MLSLAYRSVIHTTLGETQFFLERGWDPNMPTKLPSTPIPKRSECSRILSRHDPTIEPCHRSGSPPGSRIARAVKKMTMANTAHQPHWSSDSFSGYWRNPPAATNLDLSRRSLKLVSTWTGPWRLIEQLGENTLQDQHVREGTIDTFEAGMLVPAQSEFSGTI